MTETRTATLDPLTPAHLDGAVALSHAEGWPHRLEDWALILGLSRGIAALDGDRLIGTAMAMPFDPAGTLGMIVVARDWRGRGLARAMLERLMDGEARQWRLVATADGLPLYQKLGFVETHRIVQQQGTVASVAAPEGVAWAEPGDTDAIAALDRAATGMDRAGLVAALAGAGRLAVIRDGSGLAGYAALRPFGRGEVAGPAGGAAHHHGEPLHEVRSELAFHEFLVQRLFCQLLLFFRLTPLSKLGVSNLVHDVAKLIRGEHFLGRHD